MKLSKEITLYRENAIKDGIDSAAAGATNYITDLTNGVFIYPKGSPRTPEQANSKGILIRDSVDVIREGATIASYGSTIQIGPKDSEVSLTIDSNSLNFVDSHMNDIASFEVDGNGNSLITLGGSNSPIRNVITSTRQSFRTNSGDIAWFGLNEDTNIWEMHISTTYAEDMIRFGDYAWIKRSNGNMSIKWLGE